MSSKGREAPVEVSACTSATALTEPIRFKALSIKPGEITSPHGTSYSNRGSAASFDHLREPRTKYPVNPDHHRVPRFYKINDCGLHRGGSCSRDSNGETVISLEKPPEEMLDLVQDFQEFGV